jgi:hypothetical protein
MKKILLFLFGALQWSYGFVFYLNTNPAFGSTIITNGSFESSDISAWNTVGCSNVSLTAVSPGTGLACLKVERSICTGRPYQIITLTSGRTYQVSAYIRRTGGTSNATACLRLDVTNGAICSVSKTVTGNAWTNLSLTYSPTTTLTNVSAYIYFINGDLQPTSTYYIDDFIISQVGAMPETVDVPGIPPGAPGSPGGNNLPLLRGEPVFGAPVISMVNATALSNETLAITGSNLDGAQVKIWAEGPMLTNSAIITTNNRMYVTAPSDCTMLVWPFKNGLEGSPVRINGPEAWWCSPGRIKLHEITSGTAQISVYGRNLRMTGVTPQLYIKGTTISTNLTPSGNNPYVLSATLPASLAAGQYSLYAHNGTGGIYGWSEAVSFVVTNKAAMSAQTFSVTNYGANGSDANNDFSGITNALAAAIAAGGGTVLFPQGTFYVSAPVAVPSNAPPICFKGAGMGGWASTNGLDLDIFGLTGAFTIIRPYQDQSNLTEIIRLNSAYGSITNMTLMNRNKGNTEGGINRTLVNHQAVDATQCVVRAYAPDLTLGNVRFIMSDARPNNSVMSNRPNLAMYDPAVHVVSAGDANIKIAGCDFRFVGCGVMLGWAQWEHTATNTCEPSTDGVSISNTSFTGYSGVIYKYVSTNDWVSDEVYGIYNFNSDRLVVEGCFFSDADKYWNRCVNRSILFRNTSLSQSYIANNTFTNVGLYAGANCTNRPFNFYIADTNNMPWNEGEQILFHYRYPAGGYFDVIDSGTNWIKINLSDSRNNGPLASDMAMSSNRAGSRVISEVGSNDHWFVYVANGNAAGQYRRVTGKTTTVIGTNTNVTLTVTSPWRLVPEPGTNSCVSLLAMYRNHIICGNTIDGGMTSTNTKVAGIQFWYCSADNVIDSNWLKNLGYGVSFSTAFRMPTMWNLVQNNLGEIFSGYSGYGSTGPTFMHHGGRIEPVTNSVDNCLGWYSVGNQFRSNVGSNMLIGAHSGVQAGDLYCGRLPERPDDGMLLDLFEDNTFCAATNGIRYNRMSNWLLLKDNTFTNCPTPYCDQVGNASNCVIRLP